MLYFAYGSNMPSSEIAKSDPTALSIGAAELKGYKLGFTRFSPRRNGGVADVVRSEGASVWGVLYDVSKEGFRNLDIREGVKSGAYARVDVSVRLVDGIERHCHTYEVVNKEGPFTPSLEYLGLIIEGAREHGLPAAYLRELAAIPTVG